MLGASTDPDGLMRAFLLNLWAAIPNTKSRIKSFSQGRLSNDGPGSDPSLTTAGKRTYRSSLFRIYMLTDPDLGTELLPNAQSWISALNNRDDKAAMLRLLKIRHPGLMVGYIAQKPMTALVQPTVATGGTP